MYIVIITNINATYLGFVRKFRPKRFHEIDPRNRFEELVEFVPAITKFLAAQNIEHHIFVVNQVCCSKVHETKECETSLTGKC
jgi:hypothetical protein